MTTLAPFPITGSTDGRPIKVTGTSSGGAVTLHTAQATTPLSDWVTLYATNGHTAAVLLTVAWGGTTSPDDLIQVSIPNQAGLIPVAVNLPIRNSLIVKAWAATANVITIAGSYMKEA